MTSPSITISPKARFCSNPTVAAAHSDMMASPAFQQAAAAALLEFQYRVCPADPTVLMVAAAKLKGAQEFLGVLLNLGLPDERVASVPDYQLTPPEEFLNRPLTQ